MPDGNPNTLLFDENVRRRIALERYSNGQLKSALRHLREVQGDLVAKLAKYRADGRSALTIKQQERMLKSVRELIDDVYKRLRSGLNDDFDGLSRAQAEWESATLGRVASGAGLEVTVRQVSLGRAYAVARAKPMQGRLLKDWLSDLGPSHRKRLEQALRISFTEGESLSAAMQRIRAVTRQNGNGLKALIRTANTHIASAVTEESYKQNSDLVEEYEWRSVLDSRTTPVCASRDGQRYEVGKGPLPPAHIGCRSTTTPVLKDFPPPERKTYPDWLKGQPASVQDEVLGPTRGRLFREGKFKVRDFVDRKGKTLTLKELGVS